MPIYNGEKYLDRCIKSLINQSLDEIEIILINDGSRDNSLSICSKYAEIDNRIRVLDKPNEGVSGTRNLGMKVARGEYILLVDGDDWIDNDLCEKMYVKIEGKDIDMCICNYYRHINNKIIVNSMPDMGEVNREECIRKIFIPTIFNDKRDGNFVKKEISGVLYKRTFLDNNNLYYDNDIKIGEDWLFNIKALYLSERVYVIDKPYYHYVMLEGSATHRYIMNLEGQFQRIEDEILRFADGTVKEIEIKKIVKERFGELVLNNLITCFLHETKKYNRKRAKDKIDYISKLIRDKGYLFHGDLNFTRAKGIRKLYLLLIKRKKKYCIYILSYIINIIKNFI